MRVCGYTAGQILQFSVLSRVQFLFGVQFSVRSLFIFVDSFHLFMQSISEFVGNIAPIRRFAAAANELINKQQRCRKTIRTASTLCTHSWAVKHRLKFLIGKIGLGYS